MTVACPNCAMRWFVSALYYSSSVLVVTSARLTVCTVLYCCIALVALLLHVSHPGCRHESNTNMVHIAQKSGTWQPMGSDCACTCEQQMPAGAATDNRQEGRAQRSHVTQHGRMQMSSSLRIIFTAVTVAL